MAEDLGATQSRQCADWQANTVSPRPIGGYRVGAVAVWKFRRLVIRSRRLPWRPNAEFLGGPSWEDGPEFATPCYWAPVATHSRVRPDSITASHTF